METRIDFLIKDSHSQIAIEEFKNTTSIPNWLGDYAQLFEDVTITPEGLPTITSSNYDGESFENIKTFAHLYSVVKALFD